MGYKMLDFHAIYERDGEWFIGYSSEFPGANGIGVTLDECRESLKDAIKLILQDKIEDSMRGIPENAITEVVSL